MDLGSGFDYEFSVRENVYMNGAMFGRSPAYMKTIYNEIMDFSELWEFENVPLKSLSSGMATRLGFSIATHVKPDILIIDEVLGVGDYRFSQECQVRISNLLTGGCYGAAGFL